MEELWERELLASQVLLAQVMMEVQRERCC